MKLNALNRRQATLVMSSCLAAVPAHSQLARRAAEPKTEAVTLALIEGLSGPFANAGEAVYRNLLWAVERVNARGGVRLPGGPRELALRRFDSKGSVDEALVQLRSVADQRIPFVLQGNSSAVAAALIDALNKHNTREPDRRAVFLNYSAVEPSLTNERCSPWHFRFDAHADMRLAALTDVLRDDKTVQRVYLIGQDYSFGQHVVRRSREMLSAKRPDLAIVGEELHPIGRIKDFLPYAAKIKASGAQAVLTGNWGNDLTLLVKAMREIGSDAKFYTFYGNALGVPGVIGDAGVGSVIAVAEWHPNMGGAASNELVASFRRRFPDPKSDYQHLRMLVLVEMLVDAVERARSTDAVAVVRALEGARFQAGRLAGTYEASMRAADHQLQQPLVVSVMGRLGEPGIEHDIEGSGFGFRTLRRVDAAQAEQPHACRMPSLE